MIGRRIAVRGVGVLLVLACSALPARAQGTGEIGGRVVDGTDAVLPGATVTLISAEGIVGGNQETVSDDRGAYSFTRLSPGIYSVRAQLAGFRTVTQPNIRVNADQTSRADLKLDVSAVEESITVSGESPLLDTTNALKQTVITKEELDALPNRTDIWSVSKVLPNIVMNKIDVGGAEAFSASVPAVRGTSGESKFMVDGMDVSSPSSTATIANFYLDPYSYEESSIQVGAGSAEMSSGGLNLNVVTRSGTNTFRGGGKFNFTTPGLANGENYSDELRAQLLASVPPKALAANPDIEPGTDIQKFTDAGAWLGGPIMRDRLWFVGTWHDQRLDQHYLGGYNPDGTQAIDDNALWNLTGKVSWQMTKSAQLSYFNNTQYKLNGHFVQGNTRASFSEDKAKQYVFKYPTVNQIRFTTPIGNRMAYDVTYSRFRSDNAFTPEPGVQPGDIPMFDSVTLVQLNALATTCPPASCDGYYTTPLYREQIKTGLSWIVGSHDFKAGYEFVDITRDTRAWNLSEFSANYANGVPTSINTYTLPVASEPFPSDIEVMFSYRAREQGAFIQDRWALGRKFVLNLGLRYETNFSWEPPACVPSSNFFAGACYGKVEAPAFNEFAPRASVVYDMFGDGRTVIKAAANRYNMPLSVDPISRLNPINAPSDTRQWLPQSRCNDPGVTGCDRNGDLLPQLSEAGNAPGYVFSGVNARYADDLKRGVVNEYTIEFQRELPQSTVVSVMYIVRQQRDLFGQKNTAVPVEAWIGPITVTESVSKQVVQVWNRPSTASANLFYNSSDLDTNYRGFDWTVSKRMSHKWSTLFGGSYGDAKAATRGGDRANPNNIYNPYDANPISGNDRPWSYRFSGVYEFPYQLFVSATYQYQVGAPETTTVVVNNQTINLAQGTQTVVVAPVGDVRYPNVAQLDLNVRKTFTLGGSQRFTPRFEVFNLTNQATIQAWVTQLGPTYHRPSNIQHGRMIKFEVAYDF
jgi:hypothetical protein